MTRAARLRAALLGLLLAAPGAAFAQPPEPAAPAPATAEPVEPVPLPRVAEQSEEAVRAAHKLGTVGETTPEIDEIESALPDQAAQLEKHAEHAKQLASDPTSLVALDEELKAWERVRDELSQWLELLTSHLTDLEQALTDLTEQQKLWKATEKAALEAVAPQAVMARIREVSQALQEARRGVERRRDALLSLQSRVAGQEQRARATLEELSDARKSFRSLLLLRDSSPIWTAASEERGEFTLRVSEKLAARWRGLLRFLDGREDRLVLHAVILAGALVAAFALRRRAAAWRAGDPRLEASVVVFERPTSAAVLLAVSLTPALYPNAPRLLNAIAVVLLVIPTLRLLPRLLDPSLVPAVYALSAFAVLDRVRDVLSKSIFLERAVLLAQTIAALVFLIWMLQPARLVALPPGTHIPRVLGWWLRVVLAALALSALANIAGWLHLGRVLADGMLDSSYLAVVLYGGVRVLRAVLHALLRSDTARRSSLVRRRGDDVNRWLRRVLNTAALATWGYVTLIGFGVDDWVRERLALVLGAEARFGAVGVSLGDVLAFVLTVAGAFLLSRLLRLVLEEDVVPRLPAGRGVGYALTSTVHYAVLLVGFLLAISAAGVDLNKVSLLAGAFGVGIGFGLQNVVNNFVSGLILLYERPVQLGDMVEVGGTTGEVRRIGIRSSTIRTPQGAEVIVPNSNLISDRVVNWTFSDRRRRMEVKVGVAYGTSPERVLELLEKVARAHPDVLDEPPPKAFFLGFGESSLDFELRAWTALFDHYVVTQSELGVGVARALGEAGIEIPFPQRDLHLRSADADALRGLRGGGA